MECESEGGEEGGALAKSLSCASGTQRAGIFQGGRGDPRGGLRVWVRSYTDLPPPALVARQRERQLASRRPGAPRSSGGGECVGVGVGGEEVGVGLGEGRSCLIGEKKKKAAKSLTQTKRRTPSRDPETAECQSKLIARLTFLCRFC